MALIKCPECGKEISDKSPSCIHCGYPIISNNINIDYHDLKNVEEHDNCYLVTSSDGEHLSFECPRCLAKLEIGVDNVAAESFAGKYTEYTLATPCTCSCGFSTDMLIHIEKIVTPPTQQIYSRVEPQVKCPKCGSTQIQIVPRRWSPMTGFLTNKTDRVCMKCMHKF